MLVLWSLVALGAPPLPPIVAPPADPGPERAPYAAEEAWLSGKAGRLDLEALSTVIQGFDITADASGLAAVTAANRDLVVRQLAADPRFRLTVEDGAIVAYRRVKDGSAWTAGHRGYQSTKKGVWRALIRLSPYAASPWVSSPLVSRADASAGTISCAAFHSAMRPEWDAVALQWNGPIAALEVLDAGDEQLPGVQEALGYLPDYLAAVARNATDVDARGYTALYLPSREPKRGEPDVDVTSPRPGELEVRGRIHASRRGVAWVRLLDGDLRPWEEAAVAEGTREIVGWSGDSKEMFYFQGRFAVPSGPKTSATAEVWFQADGERPERLGAFNVNIPRH